MGRREGNGRLGVVRIHYIHVGNCFKNTFLKLEEKRRFLEGGPAKSLGVCSQEGRWPL